MIKIIKESYLLIIIFILILSKDILYKIIDIEENVYNPLKCEFLENDYNKLLEFNNIDIIYNNRFFNTTIIYKNIYNYLNEITIRGGKDKNFKKYPVIYDNTLIGIISKVNESSSIVKLITNKTTQISVKINEFLGVLKSDNGKLIVYNIDSNSKINIGDLVYPSGLGNIHENIYIGTVKNIEKDSMGLEKIIEVEYKINIKNIDYVTVLEVEK